MTPLTTHHFFPSFSVDRKNRRAIQRVRDESTAKVEHGGWIEAVAASVSADLVRRMPRQNKKQREGLALLVATMLDVRNANLTDLSASLPQSSERIDMRYRWIARLLGNEHIDAGAIMAPFAGEILQRASVDGQRLGLIIDQTQGRADGRPFLRQSCRNGLLDAGPPHAATSKPRASPATFTGKRTLSMPTRSTRPSWRWRAKPLRLSLALLPVALSAYRAS
jgi:hypothetical protein